MSAPAPAPTIQTCRKCGDTFPCAEVAAHVCSPMTDDNGLATYIRNLWWSRTVAEKWHVYSPTLGTLYAGSAQAAAMAKMTAGLKRLGLTGGRIEVRLNGELYMEAQLEPVAVLEAKPKTARPKPDPRHLFHKSSEPCPTCGQPPRSPEAAVVRATVGDDLAARRRAAALKAVETRRRNEAARTA